MSVETTKEWGDRRRRVLAAVLRDPEIKERLRQQHETTRALKAASSTAPVIRRTER